MPTAYVGWVLLNVLFASRLVSRYVFLNLFTVLIHIPSSELTPCEMSLRHWRIWMYCRMFGVQLVFQAQR